MILIIHKGLIKHTQKDFVTWKIEIKKTTKQSNKKPTVINKMSVDFLWENVRGLNKLSDTFNETNTFFVPAPSIMKVVTSNK